MGGADYQAGLALAVTDDALASIGSQGSDDTLAQVFEIFDLGGGAPIRRAAMLMEPGTAVVLAATRDLVALSAGVGATWIAIPIEHLPPLAPGLPPRPLAFAGERLVVGDAGHGAGDGTAWVFDARRGDPVGRYTQERGRAARLDGSRYCGRLRYRRKHRRARRAAGLLVAGPTDPFFSVRPDGSVEIFERQGAPHGPTCCSATYRRLPSRPIRRARARGWPWLGGGAIGVAEDGLRRYAAATGGWLADKVILQAGLSPIAVAAGGGLVAVAVAEGQELAARRHVLVLRTG